MTKLAENFLQISFYCRMQFFSKMLFILILNFCYLCRVWIFTRWINREMLSYIFLFFWEPPKYFFQNILSTESLEVLTQVLKGKLLSISLFKITRIQLNSHAKQHTISVQYILSQPNSNTKRSWGDHIIEWNPPHPTQTFKALPGNPGRTLLKAN